MSDAINPDHYKNTPPGIERECIEYTRQLGFAQGNAAKYVYRAGSKGALRQDLEKAQWYIYEALNYGPADGVVEAPLGHTVDPSASPRSELFALIIYGHMDDARSRVDRLLAVDLGDADFNEWE